jgi:succinoglycan biosynthesis protein ExoM
VAESIDQERLVGRARAKIDVCVASYKRPELLARLLRALVSQETEDAFVLHIAVADNDSEGSARAVVDRFAGEGCDVCYALEPEQNVSLARNKSLSLAIGDFIATIDDDLYPDPRWLLTLYRAITEYGADVVHGPVVPEFQPDAPAYIRECPIFNRPNPPTGSTEGYFFTTANALFRRSLVAGSRLAFDPRFGRTGGEDSDFFNRLRDGGARMVWCREAVVNGPVPAERANLGWILKRRFRYGYMHPLTGARATTRAEVRAAGREMVKLGLGVPWDLAAGLLDRRRRDRGMKGLVALLMHLAFGLGIAARYANVSYEEYRAR